MFKSHFDKVFWYVVGGSFFVSAYVVAVTFLPIPKENLRFVDTCLGFLLGTVMGNGINYLVGGNAPVSKKPTDPNALGEPIKDGDEITVTKE